MYTAKNIFFYMFMCDENIKIVVADSIAGNCAWGLFSYVYICVWILSSGIWLIIMR